MYIPRMQSVTRITSFPTAYRGHCNRRSDCHTLTASAPPITQGPPPRDAGIIAARATRLDDSVRVEVGAAHSGQSMAIATLKGGSAAVADEITASFMINTSESIKEWSLGLSWPLHRPHT